MSGRWADFASRVNPSCREMMRLFSRSLDRPPSPSERVIFALHMLHCPACRRSRRQIGLLVAGLRRWAHPDPGEAPGPMPALPGEVRERIKRALREE